LQNNLESLASLDFGLTLSLNIVRKKSACVYHIICVLHLQCGPVVRVLTTANCVFCNWWNWDWLCEDMVLYKYKCIYVYLYLIYLYAV